MTEPLSTRLNKHLALQLGVSRRAADVLIEKGKVKLNHTVAQLGARVHDEDTITVNDQAVANNVAYQYLLFHKPIGYVCSRKSQGDSPTIYALLPSKYHALKPVGRLDRDSSGLILLTNDGDFAYRMTHPKFAKTKSYEAQLDHNLEPLHQQMISDYGIQLADGVSKLLLERSNDRTRTDWRVTMSEGRNRQIRRTFTALGYTVVKLHRTHFGSYSIGDIKPGEYRVTDMQ